MSIKVTTTGKLSKYKKILVYGPSGVGKTRMNRTVANPLIISSENKFESLAGDEYTVWTVETIDDFEEAIDAAIGKKGKKFDLVTVDSISDIAEVAIFNEKKNHNDPRKAYGVIQDKMLDILRRIRDQDKRHFYIIAKVHMFANDENMDQYQPRMPGKNLGPELPYLFDYVFAMRKWGDDDEEGNYTYLQTSQEHDIKWVTKDSSGKLKLMEEPNLTKIMKKLSK